MLSKSWVKSQNFKSIPNKKCENPYIRSLFQNDYIVPPSPQKKGEPNFENFKKKLGRGKLKRGEIFTGEKPTFEDELKERKGQKFWDSERKLAWISFRYLPVAANIAASLNI